MDIDNHDQGEKQYADNQSNLDVLLHGLPSFLRHVAAGRHIAQRAHPPSASPAQADYSIFSGHFDERLNTRPTMFMVGSQSMSIGLAMKTEE